MKQQNFGCTVGLDRFISKFIFFIYGWKTYENDCATNFDDYLSHEKNFDLQLDYAINNIYCEQRCVGHYIRSFVGFSWNV